MISWFKAKHKLFNVNREGMISLKYALRIPREGQIVAPPPPGLASGKKSGPAWQGPTPSHHATDHKLAFLEDKIIKWLSKRGQVSTTEMAEFAYSAHEDLVPGRLPMAVVQINMLGYKSVVCLSSYSMNSSWRYLKCVFSYQPLACQLKSGCFHQVDFLQTAGMPTHSAKSVHSSSPSLAQCMTK